MGILFAALASLFASFNNFTQRRSLDVADSCKGFLIIQLFTSFCVMIILNPLIENSFEISKEVSFFGILGGLFLGVLTWVIGKTLERGPAGLTFAILSSSSIIPSLLFFFTFGPLLGFSYTMWNGIGALFVIVGLFWATKYTATHNFQKGRWGLYMTFAFMIHALFLAYLGIWALLIREESPLFSSLSISSENTLWFMPIMLLTAALFQLYAYIAQCRGIKIPSKKEVFYGVQGGTCHGLCTYFLILAPQKAAHWENAMLFPIYAVLIIIICNGWSQLIYKEKVHWKANILAFIGIVLGTLGSA